MKHPQAPKKQTQTNPISPTPKGVKQKSDAGFQRSDISFIRLMRRCIRQIRALELYREKNRLPRGSDLGHVGGNLCLWGPERFFSVVRNADCTYSLFGRARYLSSVFCLLFSVFCPCPPRSQSPSTTMGFSSLVSEVPE